jgi:hypothetical protein
MGMCDKTSIILAAVMLSAVAVAQKASPQQANLDLQERCSRQAQIAFDRMNLQQAIFINHYNVKVNDA